MLNVFHNQFFFSDRLVNNGGQRVRSIKPWIEKLKAWYIKLKVSKWGMQKENESEFKRQIGILVGGE